MLATIRFMGWSSLFVLLGRLTIPTEYRPILAARRPAMKPAASSRTPEKYLGRQAVAVLKERRS